ncbi:hypothetical protein [Derxia lacustris]|uniref:hypothetical protein n=1 Tax=Derxia lacustris TaxID=764842 RepID=UPI000A1747FD|nr:hypothetical protein [Derxia lacustris]
MSNPNYTDVTLSLPTSVIKVHNPVALNAPALASCRYLRLHRSSSADDHLMLPYEVINYDQNVSSGVGLVLYRLTIANDLGSASQIADLAWDNAIFYTPSSRLTVAANAAPPSPAYVARHPGALTGTDQVIAGFIQQTQVASDAAGYLVDLVIGGTVTITVGNGAPERYDVTFDPQVIIKPPR